MVKEEGAVVLTKKINPDRSLWLEMSMEVKAEVVVVMKPIKNLNPLKRKNKKTQLQTKTNTELKHLKGMSAVDVAAEVTKTTTEEIDKRSKIYLKPKESKLKVRPDLLDNRITKKKVVKKATNVANATTEEEVKTIREEDAVEATDLIEKRDLRLAQAKVEALAKVIAVLEEGRTTDKTIVILRKRSQMLMVRFNLSTERLFKRPIPQQRLPRSLQSKQLKPPMQRRTTSKTAFPINSKPCNRRETWDKNE